MSPDCRSYRLVLIEWEDSNTWHGWTSLASVISDPAMVCRSVGWLVYEDAGVMVIAPHTADATKQGNGVMSIPVRSILRVVDLDERHTTNVDSATS